MYLRRLLGDKMISLIIIIIENTVDIVAVQQQFEADHCQKVIKRVSFSARWLGGYKCNVQLKYP